MYTWWRATYVHCTCYACDDACDDSYVYCTYHACDDTRWRAKYVCTYAAHIMHVMMHVMTATYTAHIMHVMMHEWYMVKSYVHCTYYHACDDAKQPSGAGILIALHICILGTRRKALLLQILLSLIPGDSLTLFSNCCYNQMSSIGQNVVLTHAVILSEWTVGPNQCESFITCIYRTDTCTNIDLQWNLSITEPTITNTQLNKLQKACKCHKYCYKPWISVSFIGN